MGKAKAALAKVKPAPKPDARKAPAKEAAKRKAEPMEKPRSLRFDYPREFDNGRRAAAANIPKSQAPVFFNDDEKAAWNEGYDGLNG